MRCLPSELVSGYSMQNKMATKKVFEVDETSIVDLKAELFRKEQQFRKESGSSAAKTKTADSKKRPPVWSKQPKNTISPSKTQQLQDNDGPSEEEKTLQKSRQMLEAKAALYEKMAKGEIEENEEETEMDKGIFLVDFHKKIYYKVTKQDSDEKHSEDIGPPTPPPSCLEEEWVDFVDSLGRSRKCLRKDFKELQERDRELLPKRSSSPPTLLSDDMRREIMRKKWEDEEEEMRNRPVGPVHYQNIQFDEVRNHGVGYYQFSKVEEQRQKQMETLKKLREETLDQRSRIEKIKDRRKAVLEARLAKVRARKKMKEGELMGDEEVSRMTEDKNTGENENKKGRERNNIDEKEVKEHSETQLRKSVENANDRESQDEIKPTRKTQLPEWARHKIAQPDIRNTYMNKRREERSEEFAPPSFYYEETNKESEQAVQNKPWRGSKRPKLYTQPDESPPGSNEATTEGSVTQEMENEGSQQVLQNYNTNQQWPPPHYPPYPPPPGNLLPPDQTSGQGPNYPPLPPPPQEISQFPPPCFTPFPPPPYHGGMQPPPPPLHPPWLPAPWQQFPGQQVPVPNQLPQNTFPKEQSLESGVYRDINSGYTTEKHGNRSSSANSTQALSSEMMSDGNIATTDTNQMVADFVSSLRP